MAHSRLWWTNRHCDRTTWRRYWREFSKDNLPACQLWKTMYGGDDVARLVLADLAEEAGFDYLARFIRNQLTCKRPAWMGPRRRRRKR